MRSRVQVCYPGTRSPKDAEWQRNKLIAALYLYEYFITLDLEIAYGWAYDREEQRRKQLRHGDPAVRAGCHRYGQHEPPGLQKKPLNKMTCLLIVTRYLGLVLSIIYTLRFADYRVRSVRSLLIIMSASIR